MHKDLLESVLEGAVTQQQSSRTQAAADPLAELLQGILGGARSQSSGSSDLGGLLESILGGGQSAPSQSSGGLGGLLESILGGGQVAPSTPSRAGAAQSAGGLQDILGSILGGSSVGSNSFLGPIISGLAEKLGLPPAVAQMVVSFLMTKLLSGSMSQAGMASAAAGGRTTPQPAPQQGYDLDHLLEGMSSPRGIDAQYLRSTGLSKELAQQTGLDQATATRSLQEALRMLGGQTVAQHSEVSQPTPGTLDHLLDTW